MSFNVKAENIMQFTGGNYIFAENGRLIFNLDPSVLEAREWHYNQNTDSFDTEFKTNMQLRTLYTDSFHGYEARLKNQFLQVAYGYSPTDRYAFRPVYYRKAFLPAVGWAVRVGAVVARQVLPPLIQRCLTNSTCNIAAGVIAAHVCAINYGLNIIKLPFGVCSRAEQDGYKRNKSGDLVRKYKYSYHCSGGLCLSGGSGQVRGFGSYAAAASAAKSHCIPTIDTPGGSASFLGAEEPGNGTLVCMYETESGQKYSMNYFIQSYVSSTEEKITLVDISGYIVDDMKENPTPYINSDGLGKEIRDAARLKSADIQSGLGKGSFSVIGSEPYRDPRTGKTVQDAVSIDSATPNRAGEKPKLSGNAGLGGSGSSGVSSTVNNVKVNQIGRNDVEDSAKVGKPNNPNGINSGSKGNSSNSGSGKGNGKGDGSEEGDEKGKCEGLGNTVGCMPVGDLPTDTDIEVPNKDDDSVMDLTPDNFVPSDGACPSPIRFTFMSRSYSISYEPACEFARKIRMLVILVGTITAGMIVFRGFK
ncbi:virulence factor TspB C-terminal domain-related protein [Snodgrassella gandavensis]|uniref:virulence factor TspB C-terminal domain-related protein n=1 Tax=Snodgrassella gandavensis TaxID=2946698 RepID=UPI001EF5391B|nr:virulence factor TspB C-terminal domain-related protein [Snodgrassella gandavensis]